MLINIRDRSSLQVITDALIAETPDGYKFPMGYHLNDRVLTAMRYRTPKLLPVSDKIKPTERGYARQYFCPECGRIMWCTENDIKQPAITCRKCHSQRVLTLFGSSLAEKISWAWVTLLSENYDPLARGESTVAGKVCAEWRDPMVFMEWLQPKVVETLGKKRYDNMPVWLVAHGEQWGRGARITRELDPRGARVKIV